MRGNLKEMFQNLHYVGVVIVHVKFHRLKNFKQIVLFSYSPGPTLTLV